MVNWSEDELKDFERRYKKDLGERLEEDKKAKGRPLVKVLSEPKPEPMNKLERAWYENLIRTNPDYIVLAQQLKLRLADKTWYTPDFVCMCPDGILRVYETKGFMRDDAAVKIKVAADQYWWWRFHLVTKSKGQWSVKHIASSQVLPL